MHELHGGPIKLMRLNLIAHLSDELILLSQRLHLPRFEHTVSQWLLTEDMLATMHRRDRNRSVHVVRG